MGDEILLSTSGATITTVGVTIKTLRVGARQLTKAVFGQLPISDLFILETLQVNGTIWGWVNVYPDTVWHGRNFVVQRDSTLYRAPWPTTKLQPIYVHNADSAVITGRDGIRYAPWAGYPNVATMKATLAGSTPAWLDNYNALMTRLEAIEQLYIAGSQLSGYKSNRLNWLENGGSGSCGFCSLNA